MRANEVIGAMKFDKNTYLQSKFIYAIGQLVEMYRQIASFIE